MYAQPEYLLYNQGDQTIRFVPHDHRMRPTYVASVTYAIEDLRVDDEASADRTIASGSVGPAAVSTTTDAIAGKGEADTRLISVVDSTGFVADRRWIVEQVDGQRELFTLHRIAGNDLYADKGLHHTYASGATVRAVDVAITFPAVELADKDNLHSGGPYHVVFTYTIDDRVYHISRVLWINRFMVAPIIDESDVLRDNPFIKQRANASFTIADCILAAHDYFMGDMEALQVDLSVWSGSFNARQAMKELTLVYFHRWAGSGRDLSLVEMHMEEYKRRMANLTVSTRPPLRTVEMDRREAEAQAGGETVQDRGIIVRS